MNANWFVLWVLTGKELDVLQHTRRAPGIREAIVPTGTLPYRRNGAWEDREQVMIPGYVFLRCLMDSSIYYRVRGIPHVIGWLGGDSLWPTVVPDADMQRVLMLHSGCDPSGQLQDVTIDRHKRRGRGTLQLCGTRQTVVFDPRPAKKQPEHEQVDQRPADGEGDQNPEDDAQA